MNKKTPILATLLLAVISLLGSCGTNKNTAGSRFWQAFNTRYNVYYNGISHYEEQIKLTEDYEDDYTKRVFIHPAEAHAHEKAKKPSGAYDRTIEKMQKAISLHSIKKKPKRKPGKRSEKEKEWLKREEYNPFIHNAWFLLAKAEYMKGDFLASAATFHYITKHFTWLPELVMEAKLWEALSYSAMGWNTEAENTLNYITLEKLTSNEQRYLFNLAKTDFNIKQKKFVEAIPHLEEAAKHAKGAQKVRLNFLLGQLYADNGQNDLAYKAFGKAGSYSGSTYYTKFNARIKQSAVFQGDNIKGEVRKLRNMARLDRNDEYLDQIYYAIGNLYLSKKDTTEAIANYILAAEKSTRNGIDKAISQLTLGNIYFNRHQYDLAQPCYSEAIPQLNDDYPNYKLLKKRSDVLDELAIYAQNVTLQDSLLILAKKTPEEQLAVVEKIIEELIKKEKEEQEAAEQEERLAQAGAMGMTPTNTNLNAPTQFTMSNDNSWYFYNTATKNAGKTQFQRVWGNRKLEDNWRRRNKNVFALENSDSNEPTAENNTAENTDSTNVEYTNEKGEKVNPDDPHFPEYYLRQIPKTEEDIANSHNIIQEGLYNMGIILKDNLEDFNSAVAEFNTLLSRYPDNIYRLDTYYNLYLLYKRQGDEANAEKYRQLILSDFAESNYGIAMKDPNYIENLRAMNVMQEEAYAKAYDAYINNRNEEVHNAYQQMSKDYPLSKLMPKFMFIDALAYVTENNEEKFKETIKQLLERYPDTDITPTASAMIKQINAGRSIKSGDSNTRGMLWATRLASDSASASTQAKLTPFAEDLTKPHVFVLAYPTDSVSANDILYKVAYHNFTKFVVKDFDLEQMTFGQIGLLVVKGFENYEELLHYRTIFEEDEKLHDLPQQIRMVLISTDNFNILINEGRSLEEYFIYQEQLNSQKVEAKVPEETP